MTTKDFNMSSFLVALSGGVQGSVYMGGSASLVPLSMLPCSM